jgi:hypothetical protein
MHLSLKDAAYEYWKLGCNIVVLKDKRPLVSWQRWIDERQTEEEFNSLPWDQANQFAVICGTQLNGELFLCAIDFDVKNLSPDIIEKGREASKKLPTTRTEETPSSGRHYLYLSKTKPLTISVFHNEAALEMLDEGKLCICWPSQDYKRLNDNDLTIVQDLESLFYEVLSSVGVKIEKKIQVWFDREDLNAKPYRKENSLCIRELLKGTHEGLRNEYAVRLSSYLVNFRQLTSKRAYKELEEWNRFNTPPLSEVELKTVFESAIKGRYIFGCEDPILKGFCNPDFPCFLRKKREKELPTVEKRTFDIDVEEQIELEVQRILDSDNQLGALEKHLDVLVVGETNIKKTQVVLLRSAKDPNPKTKQIILLKATEGAGKSSLIHKLVQGYKYKEVGRFSAHALDYSNLEGYEILFLKELGSMDEEKQGISTIKFLSSDDQGYTVEITAKDEQTGKFTTEQYKIPPITVVSSTTRLILDAQFERRAWSLGLDETSEQTARVAQWKAKNELQNAEKTLGLRKVTDYEFSSEVYRRFVEKYEPKTVIIPFPQKLLEFLGTEVLRVRGDFDKLLAFAKLYGCFNLNRLRKIREDVYFLSPEVAVEALRIALEPLSTMLSRIDKRTEKVFEALKNICDIKETAVVRDGRSEKIESKVTYDRSGALIDKKVRERIAVKVGKAEITIRMFFNQLENSGYVSSNQKKPKTFTLLYDVDEIESKYRRASVKLESSDDLISEMQREAQKWLESVSLDLFPAVSKIYSETDKTTDNISRTAEKRMHDPSLAPFQADPVKSNSEDRTKLISPITQTENQNTSLGLIPCPFCKAQGKKNLFASDLDLTIHLSSCHDQPNKSEYVR